ncbi:MAG: class B sortase [Clostridiales bacterium]|nr:class B sortase [Clostridiales bacterium]
MPRRFACLFVICLGMALACHASAAQAVSTPVEVEGPRGTVDFSYLQALNPECVGWLYQEGTSYSHPVLQSTDNDKYERRSFDGSALKGGSLCLDAAASPALEDAFTLLYGDTRDDGPFALLKEYMEQETYDAQAPLRFLTPAGDWQVEVFACVDSSTSASDSWRPPEEISGASLKQWYRALRSQSQVQTSASALPGEDERVLAMVGKRNNNKCTLVYGTLRPIRYTGGQSFDLVKRELDSRETTSGLKDVGSLGQMMVYAQDDPIWDRMRYESGSSQYFRRFGGGGCGPTAVAMALANLVPAEELPKLGLATESELGVLFCTCSVNRNFCNRQHVPYRLSTPQEYLRYLPVAVANFAAGNNRWGVVARRGNAYGTSMRFLEPLCSVFDIEVTPTRSIDEALEAVSSAPGRCMVIASATRGSPFTKTSHFLLIAGADEEYFYILDPLPRDSYKSMDRYDIVEVLSPGVARIRLENASLSLLFPSSILSVSE